MQAGIQGTGGETTTMNNEGMVILLGNPPIPHIVVILQNLHLQCASLSKLSA